MRCVFYVLIFIVFINKVDAQNLVPNPGFESYSACPTDAGQLNGYCNSWTNYTDAAPDYFNACSTGNAGVPSNLFGSEMAANGNAYCGVVDYYATDHKEYITAPIPALMPGATYEVSLLVSLADNARYASNGLGVYFFKDAPTYLPLFSGRLPVTPQVSYASYGPLTNKSGWKRLTQRFIADSAYSHLVVGGFLSNTSISYTTMPSGALQYSYYYIDSILVKYADTVSVTTTDTLFCAAGVNNKIQVNYLLNNAVQFDPSNIFTLQLSNGLGSFAAPISIGSVNSASSGTITGTIPAGILSGSGYRVRIVSTSPAYVSADNGVNLGIGTAAPVPILNINSPVCTGDTIRLSVTASSIITDAIWNGPPFVNSHAASYTFFNAGTNHAGVYSVEAFTYGCKAPAVSASLIVHPIPPKPKGSSNSPVCRGEQLVLSGQTSGVNDSWMRNGNSYASKDVIIPYIQLQDSGLYILSTFLGNCSSKDTVRVAVKETPFPGIAANMPCEGDTLILTTSYSGSGATYSWKGPAGFGSFFSNNIRLNAAANMAGLYNLTVVGSNGCIGKDSIMVNVKPMPRNSIITGSNVYCEGEVIKLKAQNMAPVIYSWHGPFGSAVQGAEFTINDVTVLAAGAYIVNSDLNGCINADTINVVVKQRPAVPDAIANTPIYSGDDLQLQVRNQETGVTYKWTGPKQFNSDRPSVTIQKITTANAGTYTVIAELNECSSSNMVVVAIEEKPDSSSFVIYPNANDGNFIIKSSVKYEQQTRITLYNSQGQLVYSSIARSQNGLLLHKIELRNGIANGIYMLRLDIDGKRKTARIVVKN